MMLALSQDAQQYNECRARHNALVDALEEGEK